MAIITDLIVEEGIRRTVTGELTTNCLGLTKLATLSAPDLHSESETVQGIGLAVRAGVAGAAVGAAVISEAGHFAVTCVKTRLGFPSKPSEASNSVTEMLVNGFREAAGYQPKGEATREIKAVVDAAIKPAKAFLEFFGD